MPLTVELPYAPINFERSTLTFAVSPHAKLAQLNFHQASVPTSTLHAELTIEVMTYLAKVADVCVYFPSFPF